MIDHTVYFSMSLHFVMRWSTTDSCQRLADATRFCITILRNGISIFNEEGRLLDANPAFLRLIGVLDRDDHSWKNAEITDFVTLLDHVEPVRQIEYTFREKSPLQIVGNMTNRLNESYIVEQTLNFFESDGRFCLLRRSRILRCKKKVNKIWPIWLITIPLLDSTTEDGSMKY